jgi:hypothetical protein
MLTTSSSVYLPKRKMAFTVPFARDEGFLDRVSVLDQLDHRHGVTVLLGPSGVG